MENVSQRTKRLAFLAMMLAMITALSALEHMIPPMPFLPPNVRLGLSNIITMYALFFMGRKTAFTLAILKSVFVLLMRGATASFLSLLGGLLSIVIIIILTTVFKDKISYLVCSVIGAIFHNIGQILGASIILKSNLVFYYMPVLIVSGVLMGSVTGLLLRVVMPLFEKTLNIKKANK